MKARSPLLVALLHPLNLLMVGMSVFAGLVSAWWLFPIGILLWLILVINVARSPSLRISHEMQKRAPLAQRFQRYFDRIERAQVGIFNTLSSAPPRVQRVLRPVQAEVDALTNQAYQLCQRMTTLENYRVVSQSQHDLTADLQHVDEVLETTEDALIRREYEESRHLLQERAAKLETVSNYLERVEAQLLSLTNEMDGMVAEVIRLQALGAEDAAHHVPAQVERLRSQSTELKKFLREAIEV
jgi:aspartokinase